MIRLTKENMRGAIERAKKLRPHVTYLGWRFYSVRSANRDADYAVKFSRTADGTIFGCCTCEGGQQGSICYHLAAAAVQIGVASMRRAATE